MTPREQAIGEGLAARICPTTPAELARALAELAREATTTHRTLTLARYAILVEAGIRPEVRQQLITVGARVSTSAQTWLRFAGSTDPDRDAHLVANYWTGLVLHELAIPAAAFDPEPRLTALLESLLAPSVATAVSPFDR